MTHTDKMHFKAALFATHVFIGALLFCTVALIAAAVGLLIAWIGTWTNDPYLIGVLTFAKYAILALDVVALLSVLGGATWHLIRKP